MADGFILGIDDVAFVAEVAVGVDLHLDAAVGKDAFGHDGDHVHALDLLRHDEGGGLVIGIGGARAHGGHEGSMPLDDVACPLRRIAVFQQWHQGPVGPFDDCQHIEPHQLSVLVGVAVAGTGPALGDVAHHRAGVAADLVGGVRRVHGSSALIAARTRAGVAGTRVMRAPVAW